MGYAAGRLNNPQYRSPLHAANQQVGWRIGVAFDRATRFTVFSVFNSVVMSPPSAWRLGNSDSSSDSPPSSTVCVERAALRPADGH